ncbi:PDC sensor domain-containing protein, partial [Roseateles sp. GG27B]
LTESFVRVIEEQTTRSLQTVDQGLQLAARNLALLEASGGLNQASARTVLREQIKDLPFVRAMWVLDAQGLDLYDSDIGNTGISFADRAYFHHHLATELPGLHLGVPLRSRTRAGWLISASRPLPQVKGKFAGIIVAHLDSEFARQIDVAGQPEVVDHRGARTASGIAAASFSRSPGQPRRRVQHGSSGTPTLEHCHPLCLTAILLLSPLSILICGLSSSKKI